MQEAEYQRINQKVFPSTSRRGSSCGELKIQGIKASKLAADFGTPLYIVDEPEFRNRAQSVKAAFEEAAEKIGTVATVYYASKALLNVAVAKWVAEEGLNIDVSSGGELAVALAAGFPAEKIGFHGNNKSVAEIERAVKEGVGTIVIDSEQEIERVAAAALQFGVTQKVRLRINSGVHAGGHEYLATSHEDQKFGLPLERAEGVAGMIRSKESLEFLGLHCHIGSQIMSAAGFKESARKLLSVYKNLQQEGPVPELNLGGGFGIAYTTAEAEDALDITEFADEIAAQVAAAANEYGVAVPRLAFEPGRYIAGPAGVTLYTVGTTKNVELPEEKRDALDEGFANRRYISVDGGMSDNARPALYGAHYEVRMANRRSVAQKQLVRVVGKHCETGDIVIDRGFLPDDLKPGDLVAVAATGAYCWSLSSNYNYLPRPPMVAVKEGQARLIVKGQTEEDLIAQSVI